MDALAAEEQEMIDSETEMCLVSWKLNYRQCWASHTFYGCLEERGCWTFSFKPTYSYIILYVV